MKAHVCCAITVFAGLLMPWQAANALSAGDIAIIGMNTDAPDKFRFIVLSELSSGTEIRFTDNGWCTTTANSNCSTANALRSGENTLVWTTGSSTISAGTVIDIEGSTVTGGGSISSGSLNGLSSSGDQILAYEDNAGSQTFIYALNNQGSSGTWQADATSSNSSALPPGLVAGQHEVALDELDNYVYVGPDSGTKQQLLEAISNKSNWTGSNGLAGLPQGTIAFTISASLPTTPVFYLPSTSIPTAEDNSDASTGIAIDDDFMIVGDDEANMLRVYPRAGGETVVEWSYETNAPSLVGELDLEASAWSGGKYYFIGSHSNKKSGNDDDKREHLFAVDVSGTGAATTFTYNNEIDSSLETDLTTWDQGNGNTYGFAASAASGVVPEGVDGFSIEGLAEGANAGELYLGFRAPLVNTTTRDKALIVPITNAAAILDGTTAPVFGTAIELDLGGRGIRSIEKVGSEYLILAGPVGKPNANTANNFMLFKWDGNAANAPEAYDNDLDALVSDTGGSLETIVGATATAQGTVIQLLEDNGDTVWPGETEASKKLDADKQKLRGHWIALGATNADTTAPVLASSNPSDGATDVGYKTNIVLNFDEYVSADAGSFVIKQGATIVETIAASSPRITILNGVVIIDPTNDLSPNTAYTVETTGVAVEDAQGNDWTGLAANELSFTTGASATNYPLLITEVNSKGNGGDFFELYNYGTADVDISGWKMIDSAADPNDAKAQTFASGTVVPAGGTLLVAVKTDASTFNTAWGLGASVALVAFPNPGLGGDDAVVIFDASNKVAVAMNYGTTNITATDGTVIAPAKESMTNNDAVAGHAGPSFGASNDAVSAVWDGGSVSDPRYTAAADGVNGATEQAAPNSATVGSPGNLPESAFAIAATSASKDEGNSGNTAFTFTVSRTGSTAVAADVDYTVSGGSSNPADANDFGSSFPSGTVNFAIGDTSKVITINVAGDTTDEADETFDVTLSDATMGVTITTSKATGTITNDDAPTYTLISAIQGSGTSPALSGNHCVQAILTAKMEDLKGFFLQEEVADSDNNSATSEGIFVYHGNSASPVSAANAGDTITLCGTVGQFKQNTQLSSPTSVVVTAGSASNLPPAVVLTLPITDYADWERYEGMRVTIKSATASGGKLVITNNYNHGRYGNLVLTSDEVLRQFTDDNVPDQAGYANHVTTVRRDQIILDDSIGSQNPSTLIGLGGNPLSASNTLRAGDFVNDVEGILDQFVSGGEENYETTYRIQPTVPPVFMAGNARPTAGDLTRELSNVNANIKVASVNVLNYFSQFGNTSRSGADPFTTPYGNTQGIRGANTQAELDRQGDKLVSSMLTMDADVYGLMEIQNNGYDASSAIGLLVSELNAAAAAANLTSNGSPVVYDAVKGPFKQGSGTAPSAGQDAIMVALIYKTNTVMPVGQAAVPEAIAAYDAFGSTYGNRVPVAQTFKSKSHQETFTVAVNHFKSKGSVRLGDADTNDGQGNNPNNRLRASGQLRAWLATNPTGITTGNHLLIGDFNGYATEDAITDLIDNGYPRVSSGDSYTFRGLWGSLDFAFASTAFSSKVVFGKNWAVNAPEPRVLDYNTEYKTSQQVTDYYDTSAYRSSDHDPVLVGLALTEMLPQAITNFAATPSAPEYSTNGTFTVSATGGGSGNAVTFASTTASVCTISGTTVTIQAAGTCSLTANQAGNDVYHPATEVSLDVTIAKAPQTITNAAANPTSPMFVANGTFTVSATGGDSGNALVFASSNAAICTVSGTTVTMISAGTCPLTIDQAGNSNYANAAQETLDVVIQSPNNLAIDTNNVTGGQALDALTDQTIQVTGGTAPYQFSIAQGSLPQGVTLDATSGMLSGTPQEAGDFAFTVQVRDANGQVSSQSYTLSVAKVPQVITFNAQQPSGQMFVANATFDLNPMASADSNLPVAYTTADDTVCTISGTTVTMIAEGNCEVIADQPGNDLYSPAATVTQSIALQGESLFSDGFED